MAFEGFRVMIPGLKAGATLTSKQYHFCEMSADNTITVCNNDGDLPVGVIQSGDCATDEAVDVAAFGIVKVKAKGALSAGNACGPASDGRCEAKTVGTNSDEYAVGIVIDGVSNSDEIATILLCCLPNRAS